MYEKKIAELVKQLKGEQTRAEIVEEELDILKQLLSDSQKTIKVSYLCFCRSQ